MFGVDLDGVCADYTSQFRDFVASELRVDPSELPMERSWDFNEWGLTSESFEYLHHKAVTEHRLFRDLPTFDGCADVLWRLSDAGIWIRIITHRLYVNWGHATVVSDTVTWLDTARIPYRDLCFLGNKPDMGADIYVDDAPHNVIGLRQAGSEAIVFDQSYNRHIDGPRASNWLEVETIVMDAAAAKQAIQPQLPGLPAGADRLDRRRATG